MVPKKVGVGPEKMVELEKVTVRPIALKMLIRAGHAVVYREKVGANLIESEKFAIGSVKVCAEL